MTIQNYAIVDATNTVINVIAYDGVSPYTPPTGTTLVQSDVAAIGWTYANGIFTNPNANQGG